MVRYRNGVFKGWLRSHAVELVVLAVLATWCLIMAARIG